MSEPARGPVVIVGAGQAGMQLASGLRQLGSPAPITLIGDEPWPPYERPPLSKAYLAGELERERLWFRHEKAYAEQGIDLRLATRVTAIDRAARTVTTDKGDVLPYEYCVLATGARARRLDVPGAALAGVHVLRGLDDADHLRTAIRPGLEVAVVGGGYIGMEIAASLTKLGGRVTVIEAAPRIMSRGIAPLVADHVARRHRAEGVRLEIGAGVAGFVGDGTVRAVRLVDGREVAAELVVVGIGAAVNDELAAGAGLLTDGGVRTDACARTDDPAIFAIGDVAVQDHAFLGRRVRLESVQNAVDQAKAVARTLASGTPTPMAEVPWFWTQQFDMMIQMVGLADPGLEWVLRGRTEDDAFAAYGLAGGAIAAVQAVNRGTDYALGRRLVRERVRTDPTRLADPDVDPKSLLPARRPR
jgi:3-phenylpropionate/trans-cinnamate dioxygenase ferredoxin reductase subunit